MCANELWNWEFPTAKGIYSGLVLLYRYLDLNRFKSTMLALKEHCQGLRADGDLISLVVPEASEPLPDQQVDGDDKTFLPRTDMMARSQAPEDA
jgi:hypothetical protein